MAEQYTAAQVYGAISAALRAEDMPAVADLMLLLAVVDPGGAEAIRTSIDFLASVEAGDDRG